MKLIDFVFLIFLLLVPESSAIFHVLTLFILSTFELDCEIISVSPAFCDVIIFSTFQTMVYAALTANDLYSFSCCSLLGWDTVLM